MSAVFLFLSYMLPATALLGLHDVLTRKTLKTGVHEQFLLGVTLLCSGFCQLLAALAFGFSDLSEGFWFAFAVSLVLNIFGQLFWYRAFKREEASTIAPLRLLTPPLVLISGFLILGEAPTLGGITGVGIIVLGFWWFFYGEARYDHLLLRTFFTKPGVLWGLLGAVFFAASFPFDKRAVLASSALTFGGLIFLSIGASSLLLWYIAAPMRDFKAQWYKVVRALPLFVATHAIGVVLSLEALKYAFAAYAVSVKRLSALWAVIFSGLLLKESNITHKLTATAVILAGIVVMILWG